jgi:hypothetical protein
MKPRPFHLILFIALALSGSLAYGQDSLGAGPKKARTLEDYQPSTLKEIAVADPNRDGLLPFRVRVAYTASVRPISRTSNDVLRRWAQCCAGNPDHYTKAYRNEMQFVEHGTRYWVGVQERLVTDLQGGLKFGEAIDLFLIRVCTRKTNGKRGLVLLVERFQRAGTIDAQLKASVDSIRGYLLSSAEKDLKVEVSGPCRLKFTHSAKKPGVTRAVVFLPLTDLDPMKISVLEGQLTPTWGLVLRTIAGKRSIRFMLYQGSPAEGGESDQYSLVFGDRQNAEAMAEVFRGAINICAGATAPPVK